MFLKPSCSDVFTMFREYIEEWPDFNGTMNQESQPTPFQKEKGPFGHDLRHLCTVAREAVLRAHWACAANLRRDFHLRAQPSHEIAVPPKNAKGISHLGIVSGRAACLTEAVRRQEEASVHVFAGDVGTFKTMLNLNLLDKSSLIPVS